MYGLAFYRREQSHPQLFELCGIPERSAGEIAQVEDVYDAGSLCVDFSEVDVEAEREQRPGNRVQQSYAVRGVNFDHGVFVRRLTHKPDLGLLRAPSTAAVRMNFFPQALLQRQIAA